MALMVPSEEATSTILLKQQVLPEYGPDSSAANSYSYCDTQSQPPHSHCPSHVPTESPGLPFSFGNSRFQGSAVAMATPPPIQTLLGRRMGSGSRAHSRYLGKCLWPRNKQKSENEKTLTTTTVGGKTLEKNTLREVEGGA